MCSVCDDFWPGCPCCGPDNNTIECPVCDGEGRIYCDENGNQIPYEIYIELPIDERMVESCDNCGGSGEI